MDSRRLGRREFLRLAGAGALLSPAVAAYSFHRSARGEPFPLDAPNGARHVPVRNAALPCKGPVLVLTADDTEHPFDAYLGEILRVEGMNCFDLAPLSVADPDGLDQYDIVVLGAGRLNSQQIDLLEGYVFRGGRLVCMRPDPGLATLLGIERLGEEIKGGYLSVAPDVAVGSGITAEPLQFHGAADRYRLAGARAVAWLSGDRTAQGNPAVTIHEYGSGQAAMWAFDLARSVAYMRQGNPALVNQDTDGLEGARTVDLFKGWVDLDRISVPQADELHRLLVNLLSALTAGGPPLPRLWYFPAGMPGMLVATGDSHMNPAPFVEEVLSLVEERGGHFTVYYSPLLESEWSRTARVAMFAASDGLPVVGSFLKRTFRTPTPALVRRWRARGHEFALHPWVEEGLVPGWRRYWQEFTGRGYGLPPSTVRTHRVLWSDWTETARVQRACGIRMNFDYYHVGPSLRRQDGRWVAGHLTGSGQPMKFVAPDGTVLDIYQQNTQLADEHLLAMDVPGWGGWPDLTTDEAIEVSRGMLRRSVENGGYSAITVQFHVDPFQVGGEAALKARSWLEGTLDGAVELGVPIRSAEEWLHFTDTRQSATFDEIEWQPAAGRLDLRLNASSDAGHSLAVMVPLQHDGLHVAGVEVDAEETTSEVRTVGGVTYAVVSLSAAPHRITAIYQ